MDYPRLSWLKVTEFRSLADVKIPLGALTVLVGPNGSGKTNVLNVLRFLATTVRFDLSDAIKEWGGFERVKRQGSRSNHGDVAIKVSGQLTEYSSPGALDEYELCFWMDPNRSLTRKELFRFKRTQGPGRRITITGTDVDIGPDKTVEISPDTTESRRGRFATTHTTGLSTLPRLSDEEGGEGIRDLAGFLSSMRVLEPDMNEARRPSRLVPGRLSDDAGNIAAALHYLSTNDPESFDSLLGEMRYCLPGLDSIKFVPFGGPGKAVAVVLHERGVSSPIYLSDASFGTVRLLALLTALHEPDPPPFTAIEEVDHGLHPYALDLLVDRLRAASERTQILVTTHSPTLVNRLRAPELLVCARDPQSGASLIPYTNSERINKLEQDSELGLGELWFAGAVGGVPDMNL